jgi:hypothetical protein
MKTSDLAALKSLYGEHWLIKVQSGDFEAMLAVPKVQSTPEKTAAAELMAGATVRCKP